MKMRKFNDFRFMGIAVFLVLLLVGCADKYSKTDLLGDWGVSEWKKESSGAAISNKMDMNFKTDGQYTIDYGAKKENGKYWISGDYLHTVAEGKSEMSVRIMNLNSDSLVMQMNRGGDMERVVLLKK